MVLKRDNELYKKDGMLLTTPNIKSDILERLAQSIYTYTAYPSALPVLSVAEALIEKHPSLKDRGALQVSVDGKQALNTKWPTTERN